MDMREALKGLATDFFYWWHNQPGANTQDGFDDYAETEVGKKHIEAALQSQIPIHEHALLSIQQQMGVPIGEVKITTQDGKLYYYANWPPEAEAARSKSQPAMGSGAEPVGYVLQRFLDESKTDSGRCSTITAKPWCISGNDYQVPLYTHPAPTAQDSRLLQQRIEELEYIEVELRRQLQAARAFNGEFQVPEVAVHYWQGDGEDHLESLCSGVPVVIEVQTLRELLAAQDSKVPEGWQIQLESIQKSISALLGSDIDGTELSEFDRDMMEGAEAACGSLYRLLSAAPSLAEKPDHTEQPLAMVADKPQWVSCEERLPTEADGDCFGKVWVMRTSGDAFHWLWRDVINHQEHSTHWMPTGLQRPQPPEGE